MSLKSDTFQYGTQILATSMLHRSQKYNKNHQRHQWCNLSVRLFHHPITHMTQTTSLNFPGGVDVNLHYYDSTPVTLQVRDESGSLSMMMYGRNYCKKKVPYNSPYPLPNWHRNPPPYGGFPYNTPNSNFRLTDTLFTIIPEYKLLNNIDKNTLRVYKVFCLKNPPKNTDKKIPNAFSHVAVEYT